ncbi:Glutamyl-tRNA amidotransferase subunit B, mitochondrial [Patellaria atrata CBS 101060]|uniref:Glutamyl-tRNA(Gln) amidotransferase subunit B, mitochondrial n=1 Tax=Patellaria atrata CBS 101060 TaxID=1346257 RepID=A0A9P4S2Q3_9PEZI|nr:Glutamyl-tRNA amidotransferase subunit B, mitochondrial [Patellaria atrata CBS 101060]
MGHPRNSINSRLRITSAQLPYICRGCMRRLQLHGGQPLRVNAQPRTIRALHITSITPEQIIPFRKQVKDEAKERKSKGKLNANRFNGKASDDRLKNWELTVGIEIHAELNTGRKLFSSAATSSGDVPNTHVALFDVAFPGSQPQFQKETLIPALRAALALQCDIQRKSSFDRKHYFYQDQPNGYQITQYYEPFAKGGRITLYDHDGIAPEDGKSVTIGIKQIQMEQDTAKTIQYPPSTHLLDFNRVSHPLIEIITLPHIHHPSTAAACVRKIQQILKSVNAVVTGMELGGLRADVNVSVRRKDKSDANSGRSYAGVTGLGQRTEIKNLSSFKAVEDAISAERDRQISVLEAGGVIEGETRGWSLGSTETRRLRGKEGEIDYRYMPDPDLGPVIIGEVRSFNWFLDFYLLILLQTLIEHLHKRLPLLPDDLVNLLTDPKKYNISLKDAKTLVALDDGERLEFYFEVCNELNLNFSKEGEENISVRLNKAACNWVLHELGGLLTTSGLPWDEQPIDIKTIASIVWNVDQKRITGTAAKQVLATKFEGDKRAVDQIVEEEDLLLRPLSDEQYLIMAEELVTENPAMVKAIKDKGQKGKIMWFVGQMMRKGGDGRVEAGRAEQMLKKVLDIP